MSNSSYHFPTNLHEAFLLNALIHENDYTPLSTSFSSEQQSFFSLGEYLHHIVENCHETIQAIIFSSYRVDKDYLLTQLTQLYLHTLSTFPVLVLHDDSMEDDSHTEDNPSTQSSYFISHRKTSSPSTMTTSTRWPIVEHDMIFPGEVSYRQVSPQWLSSSFSKKYQKNMWGVHHPKYTLIFTNLSLHVIISTGNLTVTQSVDASWCQRFPRLDHVNLCDDDSEEEEEEEDSKKKNSKKKGYENNFGVVLENFLINQCKHIVQKEKKIEARPWLREFARCFDIKTSFDFSQAKVALVSTVPGRYRLPPLTEKAIASLYSRAGLSPNGPKDNRRQLSLCADCKEEHAKLCSIVLDEDHLAYGARRMRDLIEELDEDIQRLITKDDLLLAQPTSIGECVNNTFIGDWLEALMPEKTWTKSTSSSYLLGGGGHNNNNWKDEEEEVSRSDCWHLVWPSMQFVEQVVSEQSQYSHHVVVNDGNDTDDDDDDESDGVISKKGNGKGMLFLHPRAFASMEADIHTQFVHYQPNLIAPYKEVLNNNTPHFKSYTRFMRSAAAAAAGQIKSKCSCPSVAWLLMTSACLSRGAQGSCTPYSVCHTCHHLRQGYWEYRNFELGVMFRSSSSRRYRLRHAACPEHGHDPRPVIEVDNEVYLPLPYQALSLQPFCDSKTGKLLSQPFFSEAQEAVKFAGATCEYKANKRLFSAVYG